jgi:hypothetical protein
VVDPGGRPSALTAGRNGSVWAQGTFAAGAVQLTATGQLRTFDGELVYLSPVGSGLTRLVDGSTAYVLSGVYREPATLVRLGPGKGTASKALPDVVTRSTSVAIRADGPFGEHAAATMSSRASRRPGR